MSFSPIGSNPTFNPFSNQPVGNVDTKQPVDKTGSGVGGTGGTNAPPPSSQHSQISNRSIDLTGGSNGTQTGDLSNAQELIAMLHATPPSDIMALAMAVVEQASAASREAQEQALNQSNMAVNELMAQAATLRQEAGQMMAGAVASLVMTVVASAISIVGAMKSGSQLKELATSSSGPKVDEEMPSKTSVGTEGSSSSVNEEEISVKSEVQQKQEIETDKKEEIVLKDHTSSDSETITTKEETNTSKTDSEKNEEKALEKLDKATKSDQLTSIKLQQIQNTTSMYQAVSQIFSAVGNFANTMAQAEGKITEAEGAEDSAEAQRLQSFSQQSQSIAQSLSKTVDQIISAMQSIQQTQADMMRTMTKV